MGVRCICVCGGGWGGGVHTGKFHARDEEECWMAVSRAEREKGRETQRRLNPKAIYRTAADLQIVQKEKHPLLKSKQALRRKENINM